VYAARGDNKVTNHFALWYEMALLRSGLPIALLHFTLLPTLALFRDKFLEPLEPKE
jgi:hypothetical protein